MNILIIGSGAREHAIARTLARSRQEPKLFCVGSSRNPGIARLAASYEVGAITDAQFVAEFAKAHAVQLAVGGPEAPLEAGVMDALAIAGVGCVGPTRELAQIETSKSFARDLFARYSIDGAPKHRYFESLDGAREFMEELGGNYVVKANGLMGGKGVKVSGDHLATVEDGLRYCQELLSNGKTFLIEQKLVGQEFSLMSFCDGDHLAHMPAVQDHKRAFDGDDGPNTGGMGSFSDNDHALPFLTSKDIETAKTINERTAAALKIEFNKGYQGILYGGFMATADGVYLIEYNARFGDPEVMNVLPLLESDLVEVFGAIVAGTLSASSTQFTRKASVCKYAVPEGYPDHPVTNETIDASAVENQDLLFYGAVDERDGKLLLTGSRAVAVVGIGGTIAEAEVSAEAEISRIKGPLYHRKDIGTRELVNKRVAMMEELRGQSGGR